MSSYLKISVIFSLFLSSFIIAAQDSVTTITYDKKREKKAALQTYKFQTGEYDELINLSEKNIRNLKKKNLAKPSEYVQQYLFQASAQYAQLRFSKASALAEQAIKTYEENKSQASDKDKILMTSWIARYYYETGWYTAAEKFCNKADSLRGATTPEYLTNDVYLLRSEILFYQEYYDEALALIDKQYDYRLRMASAAMVDQKDQLYINPKLDRKARTERLAELGNIKAAILIKKELYNEAELAINNHKAWILKNIGKNSVYYRDLLQLEAYKESYRNNHSHAATLYQLAYTSFTVEEDEANKINNLTEEIISYMKSGDLVHTQNYLRRLQMFAFQNVGKTERFQIAYDYVMAMKLYLAGELSASTSRLAGLTKILEEVEMPSYHPVALKIKELESLIARKSNNVQALNKKELEIADIKGTYYGSNTPAYHKVLLNIAIEEIRYGSRFKFAEETFVKSYDGFLKKKLSRNSKENGYYLTAYAELFLKTDRYDSARVKSKQVAQINQVLYGENSAEYVLALANYSEYCIMAGQYKEGLDSLKKVTLLSDMKSGDIEMRQKTLLSVARLNKLFGEYDKSRVLTNKAFKLNKQSNYDQDILVESEAAEQLSDLYIQTGNYSKAEKVLKESLAHISATLGDYSPRLVPIYFGYTRFNLITGNYNQSDIYLAKAGKVIDSVFGTGSLIKAESYLLAGDYFMMISDYKKAEEAYLKADNIQRAKLGKKHLNRAQTILRQASLYGMQQEKNAEIEKLYKEALDIVKTDIGTSNPLYAEVEQKYAEFLITTGAYDPADKLLEEADKFWISKLGKDNKYTADINMLRGSIAYAKGKYDDAEKKYTKAKEIYEPLFGDKHRDYVRAIGKLARVYYMKNQVGKSLELMEGIIPTYLAYTREIFPSLSFRQKTKFWNNLKDEFEFYAAIALQQPKGANLKYTGNVYNNILSTKALLLSSSIKLLDKILHSNDSILIGLYNDWIAEKEYQISVLSLSKQQMQEQGIQLDEIQSNVERLEKEMSQRSELFHKEKLASKIEWRDVQAKLKENEYAIEMIRFRNFNKVFTDSVIYAALIIDKNTKDNPDLVLLPNGKQMEKRYLKYYRNTATLNAPDDFSYEVYWQPIKNKIPDGALVYLSCDGVYNQINLEMLPKKGTETYVLDQNQIVLLTNTKDLLMLEEISVSAKKKTKENKKTVNSNPYVFCGSPVFYTISKTGKKNVPDLPGAEKEIIELNALLVSSAKNTLLLTQGHVTEDTIKSLRSPKVLHIATHGYFKETISKTGSEDDIASNPLLNSGLMLLGSGDIVDNPDNKYVNQKEGILTAYEAMDLPLDNTDIVVLSACETGRGEVQVGEGVYGLQRAFLIAGAKSIVISLFKVNDEVTQKLMLSFYQKWIKTGDKRQAFTDAKKEIKQQYKEPIYWGAFLMIEGKPERFSSTQQ
jgi:CHAT domain-containing protein